MSDIENTVRRIVDLVTTSSPNRPPTGGRFHVAAPLWEPDGEPDLTLELELTEAGDDDFQAQVDGLHVL